VDPRENSSDSTYDVSFSTVDSGWITKASIKVGLGEDVTSMRVRCLADYKNDGDGGDNGNKEKDEKLEDEITVGLQCELKEWTQF